MAQLAAVVAAILVVAALPLPGVQGSPMRPSWRRGACVELSTEEDRLRFARRPDYEETVAGRDDEYDWWDPPEYDVPLSVHGLVVRCACGSDPPACKWFVNRDA